VVVIIWNGIAPNGLFIFVVLLLFLLKEYCSLANKIFFVHPFHCTTSLFGDVNQVVVEQAKG